MIRRGVSLVKKHGFIKSSRYATKLANKTAARKLPRSNRQLVFIGHPIDETGAPLVLLDILRELSPSQLKHVRLLTPRVTKPSQKILSEIGIEPEKATHLLSPRLTGLQLGLKKQDFVLMNTAAVYANYRNYLLNSLSVGKLKHAYWFIHEDIQQIKVVAPELLNDEYALKIHELITSGKLTLLVPSLRVKKDFDKLLNVNNVVVAPLRVDISQTLPERAATDYSAISFLLSGTPKDGRKAQLVAISAFQKFIDTHYAKHPESYREFQLNLVAIGDDYISQQIKTLGTALLGKRLTIHPSLPRSEALEITRACNAVICCSLNETFALYVAEGMAMGHIVLRNNSAGMEEQLQDGVNGFYIDSDDVNQFAEVIEKLLNKENYSDKQLQAMGMASQKIIKPYLENTYLGHLGLSR